MNLEKEELSRDEKKVLSILKDSRYDVFVKMVLITEYYNNLFNKIVSTFIIISLAMAIIFSIVIISNKPIEKEDAQPGGIVLPTNQPL